MIMIIVLPGRSMRKSIGGCRMVYEYTPCLAARGHRVKVIRPLMLSAKETELKDTLKLFSPSMAHSVPGILDFEWFHISLRE